MSDHHSTSRPRKVESDPPFPDPPPTVVVTALDQEGRGVARVDGKAMFVEGALIGERVAVDVLRRKPNYELARMSELLAASPARTTPPCPYFGVCGGCSLQHLEPVAQVAVKQRVLEDALWHIGRVRADELLAPIRGITWGYRHRARLSVRDVPKKGGVLVGFREKKSTYVADMRECPVLPDRVASLIGPLKALIEGLSINERVPQVEVAAADNAIALVFRHLLPLTDSDLSRLKAFSKDTGAHVWLQ